MNEKDDQIAHFGIVPKCLILRQFRNSPWTGGKCLDLPWGTRALNPCQFDACSAEDLRGKLFGTGQASAGTNA